MSDDMTVAALSRALLDAQARIDRLESDLGATTGLCLFAGGGDNRQGLVQQMIAALQITLRPFGTVYHNGQKVRVSWTDTVASVSARMGWGP